MILHFLTYICLCYKYSHIISMQILPINIKGLAGSVATLANWFTAWLVTMTANLLLNWSSGGLFLPLLPNAPHKKWVMYNAQCNKFLGYRDRHFYHRRSDYNSFSYVDCFLGVWLISATLPIQQEPLHYT